jgi:hypothetical protein
MSENMEGGDDETTALVQGLETILCEESNNDIELACEAVFGIKLMLALQEKYDHMKSNDTKHK